LSSAGISGAASPVSLAVAAAVANGYVPDANITAVWNYVNGKMGEISNANVRQQIDYAYGLAGIAGLRQSNKVIGDAAGRVNVLISRIAREARAGDAQKLALHNDVLANFLTGEAAVNGLAGYQAGFDAPAAMAKLADVYATYWQSNSFSEPVVMIGDKQYRIKDILVNGEKKKGIGVNGVLYELSSDGGYVRSAGGPLISGNTLTVGGHTLTISADNTVQFQGNEFTVDRSNNTVWRAISTAEEKRIEEKRLIDADGILRDTAGSLYVRDSIDRDGKRVSIVRLAGVSHKVTTVAGIDSVSRLLEITGLMVHGAADRDRQRAVLVADDILSRLQGVVREYDFDSYLGNRFVASLVGLATVTNAAGDGLRALLFAGTLLQNDRMRLAIEENGDLPRMLRLDKVFDAAAKTTVRGTSAAEYSPALLAAALTFDAVKGVRTGGTFNRMTSLENSPEALEWWANAAAGSSDMLTVGMVNAVLSRLTAGDASVVQPLLRTKVAANMAGLMKNGHGGRVCLR